MRRARRDRGQTLVEFALVLPIFLIGLFALIDGARLVYLNSTLSQAAREAARTGSVEASWIGSFDTGCNTTGGPVCPVSVDTFKAHVVTAVNRMITPFGNVPSSAIHISCDATTPPSGAWTGQSCATRTTGSVISVRLTYTFDAITPVLAQFVGGIPLTGSATMVVN